MERLVKTDMPKVKKVALAFLALPLEQTDIPFFVRHPFTSDCIVMLPKDTKNNKKGNKDYALVNFTEQPQRISEWKTFVRNEIIEPADNTLKLLLHVTRPYRIAFFLKIQDLLNDEDFSHCLGWIWTDSENPSVAFGCQKMLSLFRKSTPEYLMSAEELSVYKNLKDTITVFRGNGSKSAAPDKALSWTLDEDKAAWFSTRFGDEGVVYQAEIPKKYVYAYFDNRDEREIVLNPKYLTNIIKMN